MIELLAVLSWNGSGRKTKNKTKTKQKSIRENQLCSLRNLVETDLPPYIHPPPPAPAPRPPPLVPTHPILRTRALFKVVHDGRIID